MLRIYIKKVGMFILLVISLIILTLFVNYQLISSSDFTIENSKKILILGDSNSKCAINDSIFNKAYNFSGSADSYFYSYLKLSKVLEVNDSITDVWLSFSPHNIIDNGWVFNEVDMVTRSYKYFPLMKYEDLLFLYRGRIDVLWNSIRRVLRKVPNNVIYFINKSIIKNYGGYEFVKGNNIELVLNKLKKGEAIPHFRLPEKFDICKPEILYLTKIINMCKVNNIKLTLINTPKRRELLDNEKYYVNMFNEFYEDKLHNVPYLDFSGVVMPDRNYDDLVHLNYKGANEFSDMLNKNSFESISQSFLFNQKKNK